MPSRKAALVFCNCTECCHISHHPKGRPFSSAIEKTAHLARMHLEREPRSHQTEPQVAQEDIGDIGARVFATTVLDDGPDLECQPSKLWTSREEFQQNSADVQYHSYAQSALPLDDIIAGVSRLSLESVASGPPDLLSCNVDDLTTGSSGLCLEHVPHSLPSTNSDHTPFQGFTSEPAQPLPPLSKKDRHRKTQQAITLLKNMRIRVLAALEKLSTPSHETLCEVESEVVTIRQALEKITRQADSVDELKKEVLKAVEDLRSRATRLRMIMPDLRCNPIEFDSSKVVCMHQLNFILTINCRTSL